jgi:hypothetical protein
MFTTPVLESADENVYKIEKAKIDRFSNFSWLFSRFSGRGTHRVGDILRTNTVKNETFSKKLKNFDKIQRRSKFQKKNEFDFFYLIFNFQFEFKDFYFLF